MGERGLELKFSLRGWGGEKNGMRSFPYILPLIPGSAFQLKWSKAGECVSSTVAISFRMTMHPCPSMV